MEILTDTLSSLSNSEDSGEDESTAGDIEEQESEELDEEEDVDEGIDEEVGEDAEEVIDDDTEEVSDDSDMDATTVSVPDTDGLPFDDRLRAQGYDILTLPNGFPFPVPYHWILVEYAHSETINGKFCYELPISVNEMNMYFDFFDNVSHAPYSGSDVNVIHTTTFTMDAFFDQIDGTFVYHYDDFDNLCVDFDLAFDSIGEDPSTMISDEEIEEFGEGFAS